jgi:hypothetical protein
MSFFGISFSFGPDDALGSVIDPSDLYFGSHSTGRVAVDLNPSKGSFNAFLQSQGRASISSSSTILNVNNFWHK